MFHPLAPLAGIPCGCALAGIATSIFWIWALVDCAMKEPGDSNDKVIWILVIVFTHFLGALLYVLIRRPERIRLHGR